MLICLAFLYFCVACGVLWMALFPGARAAAMRGLVTLQQRLGGHAAGWTRAGGATLAGSWSGTRLRLHDWRAALRRHRAWVAVGVPLILIPTLLALLLRSPDMLPGYEARDIAVDDQVAALLKGEQLVPPTAPPPLAFTTREVELVRPMLVDASRNWGLLHSEYSQRLLLVFKIMKEQHGYEMALLEGYRSPARQDLLASMGAQVTNARAFQSWHQYGLAADCAFWRDGKLVISEKDPWALRGYQLYGEVAESLGLTWGGRWKMMDFGHTELRLRGVMRPQSGA
jgi:peptidoglycan L-alanyl-D-glutamate endopeptidase CwlK